MLTSKKLLPVSEPERNVNDNLHLVRVTVALNALKNISPHLSDRIPSGVHREMVETLEQWKEGLEADKEENAGG